MCHKEFQPLKVIESAVSGRLNVRQASRLLQLSERQLQRLKRRYQPDSIDWVPHGNIRRSIVLIVFAFLAISTPSQ
jgi:helix-turn-helix protein